MNMHNLYKLIVMLIAGTSALVAEVCELSITTCPENLDGQTIEVSDKVVALQPRIRACNASTIIEGIVQEQNPPSIVFVIDHSYSMMGLGNTYPGNDPFGARFKVASDLTDSVYAKFPNAEVGVVVFREVLYFDHRNTPLFTQLEGQGDQSFLPLLELDKKVNGTQTGMQVIKDLLRIDTLTRYNEKNRLNVECSDLLYKPLFATVGNTNINNAFAAALQAMTKASNPKNRQFIIFLSDGEPHPLGDTAQHGGKDPFYFQQGINTPTTFTVYLHNTATTPPQSLVDMTSNIADNMYSQSNKASDIWVMKSEYQTLLTLSTNHILGTILTIISGEPQTMLVNNKTSSVYSNDEFVFSDNFPLQSGITKFQIKITYQLVNKVTGKVKDTTTQTSFTIVKKQSALPFDGIGMECNTGSRIEFYYNGTRITNITNEMKTIEVRVYPGEYQINQPVKVLVANLNGAPNDVVTLDCKPESGYWSGKFNREVNDKTMNDKNLQHKNPDNIAASFKNPLFTYDSCSTIVPFSMTALTSQAARYIPVAVNNPLSVDSKVPDAIKTEFISAKLENKIRDNSMILAVIPESNTVGAGNVRGSVTIYDVVKNVVVDNKKMIPVNGRLYFFWDGTNTHGRQVGTGTYMAIFTISGADGKMQNRLLRIGVKR
jgi:hypothetical protein